MIVACGQMAAHTLGEAVGVWPVVERLAKGAVAAGADLLVLPECTYPAYWLESPAAYQAKKLLETREVLDRFGAVARNSGLWLVVGLVEESEGRLYNSAAVMDRAGRTVGIARKSFLWDCDNRWFSAAERLSVFDTELGRMGVMICADGRAPEIAATLAARGAEMIVMPTAWVNAAKGTGRFENPQADFLIRARAREFAVPFACADKSGREADAMEYVGQSQIVDARGRLIAIAPIEGEHLLVGDLRPQRATPATVTESQRAVLRGDVSTPATSAKEVVIRLFKSTSANEIAAAVTRAGGRFAELSAGDLGSFVPARCAALGGAQMLVVTGRCEDDLCPRARAMENRVFVVVVDDAGLGILVGPAGQIIWNRQDHDRGSQPVFELNLALADDKCVTPETHIWRQRRAEAYAF